MGPRDPQRHGDCYFNRATYRSIVGRGIAVNKLPELTTQATEAYIRFYFKQIDLWIEQGDESENFDTNFLESLREQWEAKGRLSEKQINGLKNIYEQWVDV